jgi:hypothetical protein
MKSNEIYKVGSMLGLKPRDIQNIISNNSISDISSNEKVSLSTASQYLKGTLYGTISIKDFQ